MRVVGHGRLGASARLGLLAAALALLGSGCVGGKPAVKTKVATAGPGEVVLTASGTLEARRSTRVASEVSGKVIEVAVSDGQHVSEGQLLFKLDPAPYQKAADAAYAQAASARSAIAALGGGTGGGLGVGSGSRTRSVIAAGAGVTPPVIEVTPPAAVTLLSPGLPSPELLAAQAADTEEVARQVQSAMMSEFRRRVAPLVAGATAQAAAAEAQAQEAEEAVDATEIYSPMTGVVSFLPLAATADPLGGTQSTERITVGRVINGTQPVMAVYDLASPLARVKVSEADIAKVREGQGGTIELPAFDDMRIGATVGRVSLEPGRNELGAVAYLVEMELSETSLPGWRPGMSATVDIVVEHLRDVIEVPATAVFTRGGGDYVYVVEGGVVRAASVDVTRGGGGRAFIRSGVSPGQTVVEDGVDRVKDGSKL